MSEPVGQELDVEFMAGWNAAAKHLAAERAAHEAQVQAGDRLREAVEALADEFDSNIDWSDGRSNYGDNEAWESAARQLRAALAAASPTPPQDAATEGGR